MRAANTISNSNSGGSDKGVQPPGSRWGLEVSSRQKRARTMFGTLTSSKSRVGQCGSVQVVLQGPPASDIRDGIHQIKQHLYSLLIYLLPLLFPYRTPASLLSLLSPARPSSTRPVTTSHRCQLFSHAHRRWLCPSSAKHPNSRPPPWLAQIRLLLLPNQAPRLLLPQRRSTATTMRAVKTLR